MSKLRTSIETMRTNSFSSTSSDDGHSSPSFFSKLRRNLSPKRNKHPHGNQDVAFTALKRDEFEQVFEYFDEDGDGKISPSELQSCLRALGGELSSVEALSVVESLDSDGDGLLGLDDFMKLMEANGEEEKRKDLREAFGMYDMDGSGRITPKSLKRMLRRLGEHKTIDECKVIIGMFDLNGDGVLSFDEFHAMMC